MSSMRRIRVSASRRRVTKKAAKFFRRIKLTIVVGWSAGAVCAVDSPLRRTLNLFNGSNQPSRDRTNVKSATTHDGIRAGCDPLTCRFRLCRTSECILRCYASRTAYTCSRGGDHEKGTPLLTIPTIRFTYVFDILDKKTIMFCVISTIGARNYLSFIYKT